MMFCLCVMLRDAVDERLAMIEEGTFRATLDVTVTSHSVSLRSRLSVVASPRKRQKKTSAHFASAARRGTYFAGARSAPVMNAHSPRGLGGSSEISFFFAEDVFVS